MSSRRARSIVFAALVGCGSAEPPPAPTKSTPTRPAETAPTRWSGRVRPPEGFTPMQADAVERLRAGALRGTASEVDVEGWVASGGGAQGLVVATDVRHTGGEAVSGNTLESWVRFQMRGVEAGLAALEQRAEAPTVERNGSSLRIRYALPLPGGGQLRVRGRAWLSPEGALREAMCQCGGSGCTEPPACTVPETPARALPIDTILGAPTPARTLTTAAGDARVEAPGHLQSLPADVLAQLAADGAHNAPERTEHHVQGLRANDGSGVFLTDATWCLNTAPCEAEKVAENRRKSEVDALREGGLLRSIQSRSAPHDDPPIYGYEIEQRDGFWTRTQFWNEGTAVREVSCSCAGLACAMVQRTCSAQPK